MDAPKPTLISEGLRAGRLEGISFPELLVTLCRTGTTGVLCVAHQGVKKNIYIEHGRVVFAASESPDDRLGVLLLQQNAITLHELQTAINQLSAGKRLGTILVEDDSITPPQLVEAVFSQVKAIVLDLFTKSEGEYRFTEGPLPTQEVITLDLPTNALVLEGIKRTRSLDRIRRHIGGPKKVWGLSEGWEIALDGLTLGEGERLVVERLAQGEASLDDLCREVFLSNFEICQLLWALSVLGAVEEIGFRADVPGELPQRAAGKEEGFLEFLLQLCRAKETGVLYASLGSRERSFHLSHGECVFATSNDPEDGLVNFLLRRGVISLRDREETVHRLLSNKRVGTILLELGTIDNTDLWDMVRQQLIEVVYDTFRWVAGEFSFVSGPLPSIEPITLDQNLESLVVAGLQRITSWSRVRQGCGGLRSVLALTPEYLDVLDAMHASVEEWEVVNALRTPRSPLEVCQLSQLNNFRVCQILWAMKILGGLEVIQAEPAEAWEEPAARLFADAQEKPACAATEVLFEESDEAVVHDEAEPALLLHEQMDGLEAEAADLGRAEPEGPRAREGEATVDSAEPPLAEASSASVDSRPEAAPAERVAPQDDDAFPEPEPGAGWTTESGEPGSTPLGSGSWPRAGEAVGVAELAAFAQGRDGESWEDRFKEEHDEGQDEAVTGAEVAGGVGADPSDDSGSDAVPPVPSMEMTSTVRIARDEVEAALRGGQSSHDSESTQEPGGSEPAETASRESMIEIEIVDELPRIDEIEAVVDAAPWDPPDDLDALIARFNAVQRVIYRTVRSEVGAGAANFIRSCCEGGPQAEAIAGTELNSDGSWDAEGLRSAVVEKRIEDPWFEYRRLIAREIEVLRGHIGEARAHELQLQVRRMEEGLSR